MEQVHSIRGKERRGFWGGSDEAIWKWKLLVSGLLLLGQCSV
jgi:hypothetical protein